MLKASLRATLREYMQEDESKTKAKAMKLFYNKAAWSLAFFVVVAFIRHFRLTCDLSSVVNTIECITYENPNPILTFENV